SSREGIWTCFKGGPPEVQHLDLSGEFRTYVLSFTARKGVGINSVLEMAEGRFWVGAGNGGWWMDRAFKQLEVVRFPAELHNMSHGVILGPDNTGYDLVSDTERFKARLFR